MDTLPAMDGLPLIPVNYKCEVCLYKCHNETGVCVNLRALQHSFFSFLLNVAFLNGELLLPETTFTLVGAMVSITFTILTLKLSTSSLTKTQDKTGVEGKT